VAAGVGKVASTEELLWGVGSADLTLAPREKGFFEAGTGGTSGCNAAGNTGKGFAKGFDARAGGI
jgi:hypothetical protein